MRYHDIKRGTNQFLYWDLLDIRPGDMLHAPNTTAWKPEAFYRMAGGEKDVKNYTLGHKLLLVLSKFDGVPGTDWNDVTTYLVFSRHGVLMIVQSKPGDNIKVE